MHMWKQVTSKPFTWKLFSNSLELTLKFFKQNFNKLGNSSVSKITKRIWTMCLSKKTIRMVLVNFRLIISFG